MQGRGPRYLSSTGRCCLVLRMFLRLSQLPSPALYVVMWSGCQLGKRQAHCTFQNIRSPIIRCLHLFCHTDFSFPSVCCHSSVLVVMPNMFAFVFTLHAARFLLSVDTGQRPRSVFSAFSTGRGRYCSAFIWAKVLASASMFNVSMKPQIFIQCNYSQRTLKRTASPQPRAYSDGTS